MIKLILLFTTISFAQLPKATELKDIMAKSGEAFSALQKAVIINKDLSQNTLDLSRNLTSLLEQARTLTPNLDDLTKDPSKREELLAMYRGIMAETVNVSLATQQSILEKNLALARSNIAKLKEKRTQAHDIFKPQGEFSNEYYHY